MAPIDRSLLDAARNASSLDSCRTTLIDAIQRGVISPEELAMELASGSSRGSALPRSVLTELSDNAHSIAELEAQKFYATTDLPAMKFNVDIVDEHGTFIATPDGWIDGVALACARVEPAASAGFLATIDRPKVASMPSACMKVTFGQSVT